MTEIIDDAFELNQLQTIFNDIENMVKLNNGDDYMGAILSYCEKNDIEIESIAKYIKKNVVMKARLQQEAEDLNYLQKTSRLPI